MKCAFIFSGAPTTAAYTSHHASFHHEETNQKNQISVAKNLPMVATLPVVVSHRGNQKIAVGRNGNWGKRYSRSKRYITTRFVIIIKSKIQYTPPG